jgi:hypothetical protein
MWQLAPGAVGVRGRVGHVTIWWLLHHTTSRLTSNAHVSSANTDSGCHPCANTHVRTGTAHVINDELPVSHELSTLSNCHGIWASICRPSSHLERTGSLNGCVLRNVWVSFRYRRGHCYMSVTPSIPSVYSIYLLYMLYNLKSNWNSN